MYFELVPSMHLFWQMYPSISTVPSLILFLQMCPSILLLEYPRAGLAVARFSRIVVLTSDNQLVNILSSYPDGFLMHGPLLICWINLSLVPPDPNHFYTCHAFSFYCICLQSSSWIIYVTLICPLATWRREVGYRLYSIYKVRDILPLTIPEFIYLIEPALRNLYIVQEDSGKSQELILWSLIWILILWSAGTFPRP